MKLKNYTWSTGELDHADKMPLYSKDYLFPLCCSSEVSGETVIHMKCIPDSYSKGDYVRPCFPAFTDY